MITSIVPYGHLLLCELRHSFLKGGLLLINKTNREESEKTWIPMLQYPQTPYHCSYPSTASRINLTMWSNWPSEIAWRLCAARFTESASCSAGSLSN